MLEPPSWRSGSVSTMGRLSISRIGGLTSARPSNASSFQFTDSTAGTSAAFYTACKAAALSSAMLTRRKSSGAPSSSAADAAAAAAAGLTGAQAGVPTKPTRKIRESVIALTEIMYIEPSAIKHSGQDVFQHRFLADLLKLASLLSMISVCVHTPHTLRTWPTLHYVLFGADLLVTIIFAAEAVIKMRQQGVFNSSRSYLRSRWARFDFFLLTCHVVSVLLHGFELVTIHYPNLGLVYRPWYGVCRSPRPFIMVRLIRSIVRFKLPRNRIQQILKRSSQQIQNVTIFFVFFMCLYAIMGVQLFGRMDFHCVRRGTDPKNVTINDLAIPDTLCSPKGEGGYECPPNLVCMRLELSAHSEGYYGMFNDFAFSLFSVYMAASQEGWVYVLYDCLDSLSSSVAFAYFVTLIFFLAWLVKNVFIAVITETFAEIRVQFSEMWASRDAAAILEPAFQQRLEKAAEGDGWRLVAVDPYQRRQRAPRMLDQVVASTSFQICLMVLVLADALIQASFVYRHDGTDEARKVVYYYIEVVFTCIFNLELVLKLSSFGWRAFVRRAQHKFELVLVVGSTLNVIPWLYQSNVFTYFQVFRILRLIKASPMLEDFVYKIFGPGKKLGGLIVFTVVLLVITSAVSLQLFCYVPNLHRFITFPSAFQSMFQIITQEGWTDIVVEILRTTNESAVPFVAAYFVGYHLFVTLIVLSLFVAVILDNLELEEDLKRVKQLKAREETTMRTTLPWRLRVFDRFPTRPQMVELRRVPAEFPLPKVRQSFTRHFCDDTHDYLDLDEAVALQQMDAATRLLLVGTPSVRAQLDGIRMRHIGQLSCSHIVSNLVEESNRNRALLSDSLQFLAQLSRTATQRGRLTHGSRGRGLNASLRGMRAHHLDIIHENGDLRPSDSAPKKDGEKHEIDMKTLQQKRQHAELTRTRIEEEMRENHPFFDRPLFAVGRDSNFRAWCQTVVQARYAPHRVHPVSGKPIQLKYKQIHDFFGLLTYLDWTMVLITSMSCYSMLFESPWPMNGENLVCNNVYLQMADWLFVAAMTIELAVKVLANGLFFTPHAVVRDAGDVLTFFIYFSSVAHLVWLPRRAEANSLAQFVLISRAMRPMRIYTLIPHIRRVVVELCKGFRDILIVTALLVLLLFVFASFAVQLVGGKLAACNDPTITTRANCTGVFWQTVFVTKMEVFGKGGKDHPAILVPRVWTNPRNFNFDHVGNAMLALFETLSYKGWNVIRDILYQRHGPWAVIFIHIYVFIGCMIGLTLFVGVVIANYTENRGTSLLTVDQRRWRDLKARLKMAQPLHIPPRPPEWARLRNALYSLAVSRVFKQTFAVLVIVNSCCLVIPWSVDEEAARPATLTALTLLSAVCCLLFALELVIKCIAFTASGFWQSRRNRMDAIITVAGLLWVIFHHIVSVPAALLFHNEEQVHRFTYTFGYWVIILRFFTIGGRASTLKMLMLTVLMSMVRSLFIIAAMFLLVLFYAYTGVVLFGTVKYGQAVSKHVNFRSGREALVVLFRCITGDNWNKPMHDAMRSPPHCQWWPGAAYWETDCGNYYGAVLYFCSFYLIITYIVLNLLVAVIMENFSLFYSSEEDALLSYADIRNFQSVWHIVDSEQKRYIPVRRVKFLLRLLRGRLEVDPNKDRLLFKHMCHEMEKLHNGDCVSFHDVLSMLSYRSVDIRKSLQLEELLAREELEYLIEEEVAKYTIRQWLERCLRRIKGRHSTAIKSALLQQTSPIYPLILGQLQQQQPLLMSLGGSQGDDGTGAGHAAGTRAPSLSSKSFSSRRNSIPELERKSGGGSTKSSDTLTRSDRRPTLRSGTGGPCAIELTDVEETGEQGAATTVQSSTCSPTTAASVSPPSTAADSDAARRFSYDTTLFAGQPPDYDMLAALASGACHTSGNSAVRSAPPPLPPGTSSSTHLRTRRKSTITSCASSAMASTQPADLADWWDLLAGANDTATAAAAATLDYI